MQVVVQNYDLMLFVTSYILILDGILYSTIATYQHCNTLQTDNVQKIVNNAI